MFDGALEGGIGAADVGDGFAVEFGFDAGFTEDEDGFLCGREGEDARDVDCGAVGGAEDVVLDIRSLAGRLLGRRGWTYDFGGDTHAGEFLHVFGTGFCAVVRDEDYLLAWANGQGESAVGWEICTFGTQCL